MSQMRIEYQNFIWSSHARYINRFDWSVSIDRGIEYITVIPVLIDDDPRPITKPLKVQRPSYLPQPVVYDFDRVSDSH